jgi:hypothetical protein
MKRFQFGALLILIFCFLVEIKASEEVSKCNVIPQVTTTADGGEIKFRIVKDQTDLNVLDNIEAAINVACNMQKNNECFYSSECK